MSYTDYAPLLIAARKHLANAEAAAALHKWQLARAEASMAERTVARMTDWFNSAHSDQLLRELAQEVLDKVPLGGQS